MLSHGFYQSGGAIGFRDQLQDSINVKHIDISFLKNQIIESAKHQFIEGDVEHWWHNETQSGVRTRFSDDLLWLPYAVCEYIDHTGDYSILDIQASYVKGEKLKDNEDERYEKYPESDISEEIYKHCIRAIERSLNYGENGLPKIGSGDWNDGFNTIGNKGKGESVWLGFFLYNVLDRFKLVCNEKQDKENKEKYIKEMEKLKKALNTNAWDGRWYKRAFMDDGAVIGSLQNDECRIDSISQSWATISNAGDNDKKYISMNSLETHLIDREHGIIKLLDPPFEKSDIEPGYIKSYLPGTRENGGQYTHAAIWAIIANTMLGFGDKAVDLFKMINPIEHSKTKELANRYKVEPYVIPADIYGEGNLAGRGGWTWYTGSSGWLFTCGIENILGLKVYKGELELKPCISKDWKKYEIKYKYGDSIYNIKVSNPNGKNTGVEKMKLDGVDIPEKKIQLNDKGGIYKIEVEM